MIYYIFSCKELICVSSDYILAYKKLICGKMISMKNGKKIFSSNTYSATTNLSLYLRCDDIISNAKFGNYNTLENRGRGSLMSDEGEDIYTK